MAVLVDPRAAAAPATAGEATLPAPRPAGRELPTWPLWVLFAGFPGFWFLGFGGFVAQLVALPMLGYMATARRLRMPRGFGVWLLFLLWTFASVVEIHGAHRLLGYGYRATLYLSATTVFLYVYNSSPTRLPLTRLTAMTTSFLGFVIVGGFLGVVRPYGVLHTPLARVAPKSLLSNDLVGKLIQPPFAQTLNSTYVHLAPRPAAPFPYTNDWGVNFALLVPFVIAWMIATPRPRTRLLLGVLLAIGMVPALLTLNRGMLLGLAVGFTYAAVRLALRGNGKALALIVVVGAMGLALVSALHVGSRITQRTSTSDTNQTRTSGYAATYTAVTRSPLLGYATPLPSTVGVQAPSLGTQGAFWTLLFSFGFPGLGLFLTAIGLLGWRTRGTDPARLWLHTTAVMALAMLPYYRMEGSELVLVLAALALVLRDRPLLMRRATPTTPLRPA